MADRKTILQSIYHDIEDASDAADAALPRLRAQLPASHGAVNALSKACDQLNWALQSLSKEIG